MDEGDLKKEDAHTAGGVAVKFSGRRSIQMLYKRREGIKKKDGPLSD